MIGWISIIMVNSGALLVAYAQDKLALAGGIVILVSGGCVMLSELIDENARAREKARAEK